LTFTGFGVPLVAFAPPAAAAGIDVTEDEPFVEDFGTGSMRNILQPGTLDSKGNRKLNQVLSMSVRKAKRTPLPIIGLM